MNHRYLILLLLLTTLTFGQSSFNAETYAVSRNDITTNSYANDSTAAALVIYEYGNSYIDKDTYTLKTEIKKKIKILNREGFHWATETIYLFNNNKGKEKVSKIFATTYNLENGAITTSELKQNAIFEEPYNDQYTLIKFTLPNIKIGSVITYSYVIETPFIYKYHPWEFQDEIPKLYSEYNTSIPGNYDYHIKLVGTQKLDKTESVIVKNCLNAFNGASADCANTVYVMTTVPAFIAEDYMTAKTNYLSRLEYELKVFRGFDGSIDNITKTWKDADSELRSDANLGRQIGKSTSLKDVVAAIISDKGNAKTVAKEVYSYVQNQYTWNGELKVFTDVSVKNLVKEKSGNASEINILLHNLLEEQGINVKPVLMSTRENGLPTQLFPVISEFNYLIVQAQIDGHTYVLDATDPYLSFGELPFKCLNQYGRLLDFDKGSTWVPIEANVATQIQYQVDLKVDENSVNGTVKATHLGYEALQKKKDYFANPQAYINHSADRQSEITISDHEVLVSDKNSEAFKETYQIELTNSNTNSTMVYLNPFIYSFFKKNPFQLQQRTYPIDFGYKKSYLYSVQIDFGDAYELIEAPKAFVAKLPNNGGELILNAAVNEQKLMLFFKFNLKESLYDPEYYDIFKVYIDKVLEVQQNSLVVLKKK
ncbi:DUF3857 domain-containing protein [Gelidibacter salicanalis]|uniref:DUF3857 domain-containing protein n=1 Tax=Gelidibacter salicanalis TaxID=291193 RepID=A0A5C7AFZ5_9FLAO|nr:DUF3857 domain-containing protein [Gelidibacter salicanalis]TXE07680.1 DUF3857 domain-containing protein [Gelidibacter salicanalis]